MSECQLAKEGMFTEQGERFEKFEVVYKPHQIIEVIGRQQSVGVRTCIEESNIIMEQDKILVRWHEYICELYICVASLQNSPLVGNFWFVFYCSIL